MRPEIRLTILGSPPDRDTSLVNGEQAPDVAAPHGHTSRTPVGRRGPDVKNLLQNAALVVAPTTLLSGLLYWLGYKRTQGYWDLYGINQSILGFSTTDYFIRSVETAFTFLTLLTLFGLAAVAGHRALENGLRRRNTFPAEAARTLLLLLGLLAAPLGLADLYPRQLGSVDHFDLLEGRTLVGPGCAMLGITCLGYTAHLARKIRNVRRKTDGVAAPPSPGLTALVSALVVLSTFWAAGNYAAYVGKERAKYDFRKRGRLPIVQLYSKDRLALGGDVSEDALIDQAAAFRFRYSKLRFLVYSNNSFFLTSAATRHVIVIEESPQVRLEYGSP
jgi:hypothetical protein